PWVHFSPTIQVEGEVYGVDVVDDSDGPLDDSDEEEDDWGEEREKACSGSFTFPPTAGQAKSAHSMIRRILQPPRRPLGGKKQSYKDPKLDKTTERRFELMRRFLWTYSEREAHRRGAGSSWMSVSLEIAKGDEKGPALAKKLRAWARAFMEDHRYAPTNRYGFSGWSLIDDEDFQQELHGVLMGKGKYCCASDLVKYCAQPNVLCRLKRKKTISLATAQRWMKRMGYRWLQNLKGQYVDGHEHADVVYYRDFTLLPKLALLEPRL
ncbi:hypothetical protein PQX77_010884, partial [Marasmius sp. AFHP31]